MCAMSDVVIDVVQVTDKAEELSSKVEGKADEAAEEVDSKATDTVKSVVGSRTT